jgi:hypothetical protein
MGDGNNNIIPQGSQLDATRTGPHERATPGIPERRSAASSRLDTHLRRSHHLSLLLNPAMIAAATTNVPGLLNMYRLYISKHCKVSACSTLARQRCLHALGATWLIHSYATVHRTRGAPGLRTSIRGQVRRSSASRQRVKHEGLCSIRMKRAQGSKTG